MENHKMHMSSQQKIRSTNNKQEYNTSKNQANAPFDTKLSKHAAIRSQQRGVSYEIISVILDHADSDNNVGSGCYSIWLSKRRLRDRALRSKLGSALDRAAGIDGLEIPIAWAVECFRMLPLHLGGVALRVWWAGGCVCVCVSGGGGRK